MLTSITAMITTVINQIGVTMGWRVRQIDMSLEDSRTLLSLMVVAAT